MKLAKILKSKIKEDSNLGMNVQPSIILKVHEILKKDFPNSEIIQEYPLASAFYHYINENWK